MTYSFRGLNQNQYVKFLINKLLDEGYKNKVEIYDQIAVIEPSIPRDTVRRVMQEFVNSLQSKIEVLVNA